MNNELKQKIITRLGIEELDQTSQEAVFADIGETILRQIVLDIHDKIPYEKHTILKNALESSDIDSVYSLLKDSGVDYEDIAAKAAESVLSEIAE